MGKFEYWENKFLEKAVNKYIKAEVSSSNCDNVAMEITDSEIEKILDNVSVLEITKSYIKIDCYTIKFKEDVEFESFEDIKRFENLFILKIIGIRLKSLETFPQMKNLSSLWLNYNGLEEISHLKGEKLTFLSFRGNSISDISVLKKFDNCEILDLAGNDIEDISVLANMKNLIRLQLENNRIKDISSLKTLEKICSLNLSNNNVSDIKPLKDLKGILYLYINNNKVTSIEDLYTLTELIEFDWKGNKIEKFFENEEISKDFIETFSKKLDKNRWKITNEEKYKEFFKKEIKQIHPLYKVEIEPVAIYVDKNMQEDEKFILLVIQKNRIVIMNMAHCVSVDGYDLGYPAYKMFLDMESALEYLEEEFYCI